MQVKYVSYNSLKKALRKVGVAKYGKTATLLLDVYVERSAFMTNDELIKRKIIVDRTKEMSKWRRQLVETGFLGKWNKEDNKGILPGHKLIPYLNKEKIGTKNLATMDDVGKVESKVDQLTGEISDLKAVVNNLIETYDPPVTQEKIQAQLKLVHDDSEDINIPNFN